MLEAGDGAGCGQRDVQQQSALLEVCDECSFGDFADGDGRVLF
jgi:hypothetical protein